MARYVCKACKYRFEKDKKPLRCPYCGEASVKNEETASELLSSVNE